MAIKISIRYCNSDDLKDIWKWRNSELAIKNSLSQNLVKWKEHEEWFEKISVDKNHMLLIATNDNNEKLGLVRFSLSKKYFSEISINLNPKWIGKKVSKIILSQAINFYRRYNVAILIANIKFDNLASIKCFEACDFVYYSKKKNFSIYKNKELIIDNIENIRKENNTNWMKIIKLVLKTSPDQAKIILAQINKCDEKVSKLLDILSK